LPHAEQFKYACIDAGSYLTTAGAGSISDTSTLYMSDISISFHVHVTLLFLIRIPHNVLPSMLQSLLPNQTLVSGLLCLFLVEYGRGS